MTRREALFLAVGGDDVDAPQPAGRVIGEPPHVAAHQHPPAARHDLARRRLPHHAGALARILEALDQRLHHRSAGRIGTAARLQRARQRVHDGDAQIEALDALRRPVGGNLVARHAPHLFGVGLEEHAEQPLAELVAHPVVEALRLRDRRHLGPRVGQHAGGAGEDAEIGERLERLERIGIEFPVVVDAREARPLDEIVGQDLAPQVDHLLRLGKEAMAADVEGEALVAHRAADPADIDRILLQHQHRAASPWSGNRRPSVPPDRRRSRTLRHRLLIGRLFRIGSE